MEAVSSARCFNGTQFTYQHDSTVLESRMRFGVYLPDNIPATAPALFWLSGLTCTEENFVAKAGAQRMAAELGMIIIAPDTSPRGDTVPDDPAGAYDFGLGAGFYVNATQAPFHQHYQMKTYIEDELYNLVCQQLPVDPTRTGIFGHSMGGHGALTLALSSPEKFRSVSAFAPICSPVNCPWGQKALAGYLGEDEARWQQYDSCALISSGARVPAILVDQGSDDSFLVDQLKPDLLRQACAAADIPLTLNLRPGFDHSYFFIASFIDSHLHWHAQQLND